MSRLLTLIEANLSLAEYYQEAAELLDGLGWKDWFRHDTLLGSADIHPVGDDGRNLPQRPSFDKCWL